MWDKKDVCIFCFQEVTNFARHMQRNHSNEPQVLKILSYPKGDSKRKTLLDILRKEGNFILFREGKKIIPVRRPQRPCPLNNENKTELCENEFAICRYCKGIYKRNSLRKHLKNMCLLEKEEMTVHGRNHLSEAQTFLIAARNQTSFTASERFKKLVLDTIRPDEVGEIVKMDTLILLCGSKYFSKHKGPQIGPVCSSKMRVLGRLVLAARNISSVEWLVDLMKPKCFKIIISATKIISGFNERDATYNACSTAIPLGTALKYACSCLETEILMKSKLFQFKNPKQAEKDAQNLRKIIESRWRVEISSVALKDQHQKKWEKLLVIPVISDLEKLNLYVTNMVNMAINKLQQLMNADELDDDERRMLVENYKKAAQGLMTLTLILNRKRIDEVQYLEKEVYNKENAVENQEELHAALSVSEKVLCKNFKRVVTGGKRSRPEPLLFSKYLQDKISILLQSRTKISTLEKNIYLFANPHSSEGWFNGTYVLRNLANKCGAKNPQSLSSTKYRKQLATVLQVMNITDEDMEQIATFLGHTLKTHKEYYR